MGGLMTCLLIMALAPDARGCAVLQRPGIFSLSSIEGEKAVIIWDEAHKTEHFIRQANISTTEPDLGFLVPTPQTPQLVAADPAIFDFAAEEARPELVAEVVYDTPLTIVGPLAMGPLAAFAAGWENREGEPPTVTAMRQRPPVQVISQEDVGDYRAAILQADDVESLADWLKENGYSWTADDKEWLKPYVAAKWKITAFKLMKKPGAASSSSSQKPGFLATQAIRMSFSTDRPFYPYSEPGDLEGKQLADPAGRTLSVAILSNERMTGGIADSWWPGYLQYAGPSTKTKGEADQWLRLAKLNDPKNPATVPPHLTYFIDASNPRPGTADVYFSPDPDQTPVETEVDHSLPPQVRIDWDNPVSNWTGVLLGVMVIAAPIYGGKRILSRASTRAHAEPGEKTKSGLVFFLLDRLFGTGLIILGLLQGAGYVVGGGALFMELFRPDFLSVLGLLAETCACLLLFSLCVAMVYCGLALWRSVRSGKTEDPTSLIRRERRMGWSSIAAGGLFLIAFAMLFYRPL
jgi:hypothetical protein